MQPATSAPAVEIRILGPFELAVDGEERTVPGRRERAVLALLASTPGEVVGTDRLLAFLWSEEPPRTADKTLQTYVSRLRRIVGDRIDRHGAGYVLRVGRDEVDATRFEDLLAAARAAQRSGDTADAATCLDEATALWRGDAPAAVPDTPEATIWRRALLTARAEAEEAALAHRVAVGRADEALPELERRTVAEPLRERPWALLVEALARTGRPADALAAFGRARAHWADELGLDPPPALLDLQQRIIAQDPTLAAGSPTRPSASRSAAVPALPVRVSDARLVGREADRDRLVDALGQCRLVTLVGPGGVGKTTLALDVAGSWSTPAAFCDLAAVQDPSSLGHTLAASVGVEPSPGEDPVAAAAAAIGDDPLLVVVDNCEHLTEDVRPLLYRFVTSAAGVTVLATSREPLHVGEEVVVPLAPLAVDGGEAAALFRDRVTRGGVALPDDDATEALVRQVCERLDGLPLAIELAAGTVRVVGLHDLLADLDDRAALLERSQVLAGRERGLRASAMWSYDLLDRPLQALLRRSAVFVGGFTPVAAATVCVGEDLDVRDVPAMLAELADRSLLERVGDHTATRYRMLETLRTAARDLLDDAERAALPRRHAAWAVALAEELGPAHFTADVQAARRRLDQELPNLRVAVRWALDQHEADLALRMVVALHWPAVFGVRSELFGWTLEAAERFGDGEGQLVHAALASAAAWRGLIGDQEGAARVCARIADELAATDEEAGALTLSVLVGMAARLGDLDTARTWLARLRAQSPHPGVLLSTEGDLAAMESFLGEHEASIARSKALLPRLEATGSDILLAAAALHRSQVLEADDPDGALTYLERANELARGVGARMLERAARAGVALLGGRVTDVRVALRAFDDILGTWQQDGAWRMEWGTIQSLLELLARMERHEDLLLLHAAMEASETAPPLYGDQEQRIAAAVAASVAALDQATVADARAGGAALTDAGALAHARAIVDGALADEAPAATAAP